jgi:hypothetical protein
MDRWLAVQKQRSMKTANSFRDKNFGFGVGVVEARKIVSIDRKEFVMSNQLLRKAKLNEY